MKHKISWLIVLTVAGLLLAACATDVKGGEIVALRNPNFDPQTMPFVEKYTDIRSVGQGYKDIEKNKLVVHLEAASVPQGSVGLQWIRNNADGSVEYKVLPAGDYLDIPKEFVPVVPAAQVTPQNVVVYCAEDDYRLFDQPGTVNLPADWVVTFPRGPFSFRSLSDPNLLNNADACQSTTCETSLTNASVKGSVVSAVVDVDMTGHFDTRELNKKQLCALGDPVTAIREYVIKPWRQSRALSGAFTEEQLADAGYRQQLADAYKNAIMEAAAGLPIVIDHVGIRSIVVGDQVYRDARAQQQLALQQALEQERLLAAQEANQEALARQQEFVRKQALLDAQNRADVIRTLLASAEGADWRALYVLLNSEKQLGLYGDTLSEPPAPTPAP